MLLLGVAGGSGYLAAWVGTRPYRHAFPPPRPKRDPALGDASLKETLAEVNALSRRAAQARSLSRAPVPPSVPPEGGTGEPAFAPLARPAVRREALQAYEWSIGCPAHRASKSTLLARNIAACWFFMVGDRARLRRELELIGDHFHEPAWGYLYHYVQGDLLAAARQYAGLPA